MNKTFNIYKLHFNSPLHLGNEKEDYAETMRLLHSDSLYAAITSALAKTGNLDEQNFNGELGFTISSLFPFYQENKDSKAVYFFPKSKKADKVDENLLDLYKKIKKLQWLDQYYFQEQLHGKLQKHYTGNLLKKLEGVYLSNANIEKDFIATSVNPRVTVSRTGEQDAEPFYMERLFFKGQSGLFFIAQGEIERLEQGLKILQYEGIGTDRNVGNGLFTFSKDSIQLDLPENTSYGINLSLFLPNSKHQLESMLNDYTAYSLIKRGGWITTPPNLGTRKNSVFMIEEGSVLYLNGINENPGRIANLSPKAEFISKNLNHKVFRNGKSIFLPFVL